MMRFKQYTMAAVAGLCVLTACQRDYNDPGTEYAPNMYVSIPYEPLTQVEENPLTPTGANVLPPVPGTISRRNYPTKYVDEYGNEYDLGLMVYRTHPDSIEVAEKTLKNPLPPTKQVIAEGKVLYERFCQPCHGAKGQGDGLVGQKYKGVANIAANKFNDGHIFHVITHGKGRMWPHASQLNPLERWKIVHYVHVLSGDLPESGIVPGQEENASETQEESANGQSSDVAMAN